MDHAPPSPTCSVQHQRRLGMVVALMFLAGCSTPAPERPSRTPEDVRATVKRLLPASVKDRDGWAADIQAAFQSLELPPSNENLCAVLAITEQESTFNPDPPVPNLGRIAREEIDRRAGKLGIPSLAVSGTLLVKSANGRSYGDRLAEVRTERELSNLYEEIVQQAPIGKRLLDRANPVRTAGPMQVSIDWAENFSRQRTYPYPASRSIRDEVFSRRGGVYFGTAHLLKYPNSYSRHIYRFADFNAGHYASRNAAFQAAVTAATGIPLALDGDFLIGADRVGTTEAAVRTLRVQLGMDDTAIHAALQRGREHSFERSALYQKMFELGDARAGRKLPRAILPQITLESPKITRKLTTEWFANSVERRYRSCEARAFGR